MELLFLYLHGENGSDGSTLPTGLRSYLHRYVKVSRFPVTGCYAREHEPITFDCWERLSESWAIRYRSPIFRGLNNGVNDSVRSDIDGPVPFASWFRIQRRSLSIGWRTIRWTLTPFPGVMRVEWAMRVVICGRSLILVRWCFWFDTIDPLGDWYRSFFFTSIEPNVVRLDFCGNYSWSNGDGSVP